MPSDQDGKQANPSHATRFKPGQSGNPGGRPKKADHAFEAAFDALQEKDETKLSTWAADNLTDFYKLYARKLTTVADNRSHVVSETVSEEQARVMAEEYLASTRARVGQRELGGVHQGDEAGLPAGSVTQADSPST